MGKDLKGKEIGEGIYQLNSGRYCARVSGYGRRISKTFDKLAEARIWVAQRQSTKATPMMFNEDMTLDQWYEYWIENIKKPAVKYGTYESYRDIYTNRIKDTLGYLPMFTIKPLDCQELLNRELRKDMPSTVKQTLICLQQIFNSAVDNELIDHSPITKTVKVMLGEKEERRVFTADEQKLFEDYLREHKPKYADEWLFILETGLRTGELLGLKWNDVDFEGKKIYVRRSMYYVREDRGYIETSTKTPSGVRVIPLTDKAYSILKSRKVVGISYIFLNPDRKTRVNMARSLIWTCNQLGMERISVHGLRHSFATRCIECGIRPKTLQKILGHSNLNITMDLYVHVTEDALAEEMKKLQRIG